jgi:cold shock CspA family protein
MNGIVKSFNEHRDFGFIEGLTGKPSGGNPMIFYHKSAIRGGAAIPVGAEVRFEICRSDRGPQAANVELVRVRLPRQTEVATG